MSFKDTPTIDLDDNQQTLEVIMRFNNKDFYTTIYISSFKYNKKTGVHEAKLMHTAPTLKEVEKIDFNHE